MASQIDDRTVEVSAQSPHGPAAIRFLFDESGDIVAMHAAHPPMTVGNRTVPTPWRGFYSSYKQFGAYRIPCYDEVGWVLATDCSPAGRGAATAYEPQQRP